MSKLLNLMYKHWGSSFDKQKRLDEWRTTQLGEKHQYAVDIHSGNIVFRKKKLFGATTKQLGMQIVGTLMPDQSLLWAWAYEQEGLPPMPEKIVSASYKIKEFAEQNGIEEYLTSILPPGQVGVHIDALIMVGIIDADAYFVADQMADGVGLLLMLNDENLQAKDENPIWRISEIYPEVLRLYPISSPILGLVHYLESYGFEVEKEEGLVIGRHKLYGQIEVNFDENENPVAFQFPKDAMP